MYKDDDTHRKIFYNKWLAIIVIQTIYKTYIYNLIKFIYGYY